MTEERLERFIGLKQEASALKLLLDDTLKHGPVMTTDAVTSAAEFPFSKHTVVVSGLNLGEYQEDVDMLASRWRTKRKAILDELVFLENYLDTVSDPKIRAIMRYRYVLGWGWQKISFRFGWSDETTSHKKIQKFLSDSGFSGLDDL